MHWCEGCLRAGVCWRATGKSEFGWYGVAGGMATIALAAFEMKLKRI